MVTTQGTQVRELAWTVVGASAGSLARYWVAQLWPGRMLEAMLGLTAAAACVAGFALLAPLRAAVRTVLLAAGGAAASISTMATLVASATPVHSMLVLAGFFGCAVAGVLVGMLAVPSVPPTVQRDERL
ncbi:hypothetical protein [Mycobacterium servetii]|uniref:Transmembrane protein n=1 Tax=Mycobacterium servetii TaxID=3237418 RepID=A0ABV4BWY0_9MYCO